ncbi:MAG: glutaredoxin [Gammaproteobacteria bacterium]|nr:MAG: glutaredoxin [Gammaproteobacteria bacterium]RLA37126.1 MAG: glutaredoxin [Gammaproteobacteria bacterium]
MKPIQIEVFSSPDCDRCSKVFDIVTAVVRDYGDDVAWRNVNVIAELDYAVELGVISMPSIAIDGDLVFTSHPSARKLRDEIDARLRQEI